MDGDWINFQTVWSALHTGKPLISQWYPENMNRLFQNIYIQNYDRHFYGLLHNNPNELSNIKIIQALTAQHNSCSPNLNNL